MQVLNVVGARPNLMKIAPLVEEMRRYPDIRQRLLHTGQHYDDSMSQVFFEELDIPCLTLRENTERPITVLEGTNTLVGSDPARIVAETRRILAGESKAGQVPELWDGHAAERIVAMLRERVGS